MSKTKLGPDYLSMLASTNNLAFTWNVVGRYRDALRLLQTCSAFQKQVLGADHLQTLSTLQAVVEWQKESEGLL